MKKFLNALLFYVSVAVYMVVASATFAFILSGLVFAVVRWREVLAWVTAHLHFLYQLAR